MKRTIGVLFGLCCIIKVSAQSNLVPNPSFENFVGDCPNGSSQVWKAEPWTGVYGSVDYYHQCGSSGYGVPVSIAGWQYALTGQAYMGVGLTLLNPLLTEEFREYVGVPLSRPLSSGIRYQIAFHVSLSDKMWYAVRNIGVHLSSAQPASNLQSLLAIEPQVRYVGDGFLADKEGWTRIEGIFLAQGGENFLTIGNFDNDEDTDTVFVGGADTIPSAPYYWSGSYYFIDDVSVIPVDSLVGIGDQFSMGNEQLSIHPNPASEYLIIETESGIGILRIMDMAGREVLSTVLHSPRQSMDVAGIPAGVYVAVLEENRAVLARRKVVIR